MATGNCYGPFSMAQMKMPAHGLYAVTPAWPGAAEALAARVAHAIAGGAKLVQYRAKGRDPGDQSIIAALLCRTCHEQGVPFIVNDDPALARAVVADGVHVGYGDACVREARTLLGPEAIVGVSCYNKLDNAVRAEAEGASYVAFGRFFPSNTKPEAVQAELALLRAARTRLQVPIVAIGGITPAHAPPLLAAGADLLAVIDGLFGTADTRSAARDYARLFPGR